MATDLMKLVQSVLAQKRALDAKERDLIASLNRVLPDMGYRVVATSGEEARRPQGRRRSAMGAGRPVGSAPKNLVCAQCGRRFSHPLHLGRHTAATHKSTSSSGSRAKSSTAKASSRRRSQARRRRRAAKTARKTG
jgi:hypothetical protein